MRWRKLSGRLLALLIGYALAELLLVPVFLRFVTVRQLQFLPRAMGVLAQTSKAGTVPRDYTLILGDSFAEGQGDWADEGLARGGRPEYSCAHVLHDRSGEDVINFGVGGANSVTALVKNPIRRGTALRRFLVGPPRRVLAFFYEGNDLDDDLRDVQRLLAPGEGLEALGAARIDAYFASLASRATLRGWLENLYLAGMVGNTLQAAFGSGEKDLRASESPADALVLDVARIAGQSTPLARGMNAPALELTEDELGLALKVFERALLFCRGLYPEAEMVVVYVPSPLSCYELEGDEVSIRSYLGRWPVQPARRVQERSREIRARVRAIASAAHLGFVDPTDALQALARTTAIHGPGDWGHFNEKGYRCLSEEIFAKAFATAQVSNGDAGR